MKIEEKNVLPIQILNTVAYVVMIIVNILANALPINGQTTGEVSDKYPNLFTPAGITFSIWGLIYVLLGLFVLYQLGVFTKSDKSHQKTVLLTGWLFAVTSIANAVWVILWHYELMLLTVAVMMVILLSLIAITQRIYGAEKDVKQKWFWMLPFSVYLGWISVATIANITVLLVSIDWKGFGIPEWIWTVIMMAAATILAVIYVLKKKDMPYSLVIIWALIGIVLRHITVLNSEYVQIIIAGALFIGIILASIVTRLVIKGN